MIDILESVDGDLLAPARPELAGLVNWGGGGGRPIHRWFHYREGFSPALISELRLGRRILDPFCGAGSIMVGAAQQRRSSVGIDVNPLAAFVARVKLTPLRAGDVDAAAAFLDGFEAALPGVEPWPVPALRISEKVFEPAILATVLRLRGLIEERAVTRDQRNFLLLAWLSILQTVGSYFKEGNGIKYRNRQRRTGGYVARPEGRWQRERFGIDQGAFVQATFKAQLAGMLDDVPAWRLGRWGAQRIIEGSSLDEAQHLDPGSFDSVVFSPPYANRFDYFESQKVELWFGGFVDTYDEMSALRKRSLRSHLGAALGRPVVARPEIDALIGMIDPGCYAARARVPALIRGYFSDMAAILRSCRRVLMPGGRCSVVVGNSAYGGVIIPTDSLIARLGLEAGFDAAAVVPVRHLTVAPQQRNELRGREEWMRESVVVLS
ncbi:MAG TPA: SAM-dependent methyltransferase [Acidimicrobiia bacterium]|nr:SAM-dependent methyltransferase [Acidimicrobiia bacterium]